MEFFKPKDAITLEIIKNSLSSICNEMGVTLGRAAYSLVFSEGRDFSCGIFDSEANLIAQGEYIPVHLGAMHFSVKSAIDKIGKKSIEEGDMIISNDPYLGGTHLPDVTLATPLFIQGELMAFVANRAHYTDVGGKTPGSSPCDSTEIYSDGLRIPPIKICQRGQFREDVLELIFSNMRVPRERAGDFRATVAANETGVNRLRGLINKYGMDVFKENIQYLVDYVEYRARLEIGKMRNGTYRYHDFLDNDGVTDEPMKIEVEVGVGDDQITFDFSDSAKQSAGPLNMTFAQTASTVYLAMKAVTDVTIPINSGFYRPIRIVAPEGSIVNASPPAAVAGSNEVCARTFDVVMGALSEVVPERKLASCYSSANYVLISGAHPDTRETYICFMFPAGGWGARSCKDGVNAFYVLPSNAPNSPVEAHEIRYPVLFERRELRKDSGGLGEYRGGLGTREDIRILVDRATLTLLGDRTKFPPPGLFGGKPGKPGMVRLIRGGKQRGISRLGWKVTDFRLKRNDIVSVRTAGGGGFGEPNKRNPELIKEDIVNGYVSKKSVLRDYVSEVRLK